MINQVCRSHAIRRCLYKLTLVQCYNTDATICAQFPSKLTISDVHCTPNITSSSVHHTHHRRASARAVDINVSGTSSGKEGSVVVDIECSDVCEDITATDINIRVGSGNETATFVCKNIASTAEVRKFSACGFHWFPSASY